MSKLAIIVVSIVVLITALAADPPNPCPAQGVHKGTVLQNKCAGATCPGGTGTNRYKDSRVCHYWCCYEGGC